ncbi:MAG: MFS transporter [Chloroflexota bacterium]
MPHSFGSPDPLQRCPYTPQTAHPAAQLGLMTSLFFGSFALIQVPLGLGLDRWGARWVTSGLMFVGVIGSLVFATAPSFMILALGRALIGLGMAGILMGSLKVFSQWYPPQRFATASGLLVGIGSSGALIAATPLAWLNNIIGWRAVFVWGAVGIALIAIIIMVWGRNTPPGVEWQGGGQSTHGLKAVFGDQRFWRMAPLTFFMSGTLLGFQGLWAGPYLFDVLALDEIGAGNLLFLMGIGTTAGFIISGWLADRFGVMRVIVAGSIIFIICLFILATRPPLAVVWLLYGLFGFSGSFNILLLSQIRKIFPETMTGQAVTAINMFGIGGTFFIQWWLGLIIGAFVVDSAGHYPPQAFTAALLFTAVGSLIALLWYLSLLLRQDDVLQ